ncbi:hypothetical protein [Chryseobacterium sp.]|uniref:hypothetical protein n=1 Tax=Chryseobacterium sp. TaxID=1871047 RepID=UPI0025C292C0|nr:hypothetical protein [Chryseobacterium sp.]
MKQFYKSKSLFRLSFLFVALFSLITVVNSCKDDDEEEFQDHVVQFEVKGSQNVVFKTVVTQVGTDQNTIYDPTGTLWTSGEFFVSSSQSQLNLAANAELPNPDSQLIVSIWIDGEVAKSDTVTGTGTLSAAVTHSFLEL